MPKYKEMKNSFVKALIVSLSFVFIAGVASTTKAFADEPGSVFLWGGYDDDGLFGTYAEEHGSPEYSTFGDAEEVYPNNKGRHGVGEQRDSEYI